MWILDEGADPAVKAMAERLGVHHFDRAKGIARYNQATGPFRAKTKVRQPQCVARRATSASMTWWRRWTPTTCRCHASSNGRSATSATRTWLSWSRPRSTATCTRTGSAHGASVQQYLFSGVVERGGNGLDAPLLIGTNHLYRPDGLAGDRRVPGLDHRRPPDQHASAGNDQPRHRQAVARGVHADVLAIGDGPESWTDYFNQQKRWAYGIWEILLKRKLRAGIRLRPAPAAALRVRAVLLPQRRAHRAPRHDRHLRLPAARRHRDPGQLRCDGSPCGQPP